jgi:hypothetical protein
MEEGQDPIGAVETKNNNNNVFSKSNNQSKPGVKFLTRDNISEETSVGFTTEKDTWTLHRHLKISLNSRSQNPRPHGQLDHPSDLVLGFTSRATSEGIR